MATDQPNGFAEVEIFKVCPKTPPAAGTGFRDTVRQWGQRHNDRLSVPIFGGLAFETLEALISGLEASVPNPTLCGTFGQSA